MLLTKTKCGILVEKICKKPLWAGIHGPEPIINKNLEPARIKNKNISKCMKRLGSSESKHGHVFLRDCFKNEFGQK